VSSVPRADIPDIATGSSPTTRAQLLATVAASALILATLWHAFGEPGMLAPVMAGAIAILIIAGFRNINARLRLTSSILLALGIVLLPFARAPWEALARGIYVAALLLSLAASVMLLARCALRSRHVHQVGAGLRGQPAGRRYLVFAAVSQLFSGALGLAGANIMYVMAAPADETDAGRRTATVIAVSHGFSAASFWSPVFGSMALMLALYPSLHWIQVFPVGVALAQISLAVGAALDRARGAVRPSAPGVAETASLQAGIVLPLLAVLLGFLALILVAGRLLHIPVAAAIVLVAPPVALGFGMFERGPRPSLAAGMRDLGQGLLLFPTLASEALLFAAAGSAGSVMAAAFPDAWAAGVAGVLHGYPLLALSFLLFGVIASAVLGVHPVLSGVFLASTFTPDALGVPPLAHMGAVLGGWGLSSCTTPFSVLSLTASRYAREGLFRISLGRNLWYALLSGLLIVVLLDVLARAG